MNRAEYCTPPEAAKIMMCSALHVRHLLQQGKLPYYLVGNRRYIPKKAIYTLIDHNTKNWQQATCKQDEQTKSKKGSSEK